jgi:AraC-like DNA-binding protein
MQRIGVTPKYYARLCRFWKAFKEKENRPDLDWLSLALDHGYTDYEHLAKDFRQFAGVTPIILLQETARDPERALRITPEIFDD